MASADNQAFNRAAPLPKPIISFCTMVARSSTVLLGDIVVGDADEPDESETLVIA
jgi:hypothetical protein